MSEYDSILLISFGGPEGPEDVMPFLGNVLKGRDVPEARMKQVAKHYDKFDGVSPINQQNRDLIEALSEAFSKRKIDLPIYWGNRNWKPFINEALLELKKDGKKNVLAIFTSAFSSYSGCRQYRENITAAQEETQTQDINIKKIRHYFNHPKFIDCQVSRILEELDAHHLSESDLSASNVFVMYTAHSIPSAMSENCDYKAQLESVSGLINEKLKIKNSKLCFQSRSGPPHVPWLEPDVCNYVDELDAEVKTLVVVPLGFVSDHMEVMYDLDHELKDKCVSKGIHYMRAKSVGTHPLFLECLGDILKEYTHDEKPKSEGVFALYPQQCGENCCLRR